jgi:hypothetical protein
MKSEMLEYFCFYNSLWSLTRLSLAPAAGYFNAKGLIS